MTQLFVMVFLVMLLLEQDAHAYLDPGTGSLILQFLAGIALVVVLTVKTWWRQFTTLIVALIAVIVSTTGLSSKSKTNVSSKTHD